jgi:hypothetical protein
MNRSDFRGLGHYEGRSWRGFHLVQERLRLPIDPDNLPCGILVTISFCAKNRDRALASSPGSSYRGKRVLATERQSGRLLAAQPTSLAHYVL